MSAAETVGSDTISLESAPSPEPIIVPTEVGPSNHSVLTLVDSKDPESFLKRCSGTNKKTKFRCSSVIGQKAQQDCHPTFLPTCRAHRDQQCYAGWCKYRTPDGERCSKLFRWTPPYLELCPEHEGLSDLPRYFLQLPLELRHEIYRYLLPTQPIGSSTASIHNGEDGFIDCTRSVVDLATVPIRSHSPYRPPRRGLAKSVFPTPPLDIFLICRQVYQEVKDLLFGVVPFIIDVRKDGAFMCGRRLLEPRRADGSSHFIVDEFDETKQRFLKYFDWSSVKHYAVNILVENWADQMQTLYPNNSTWDEEVEIYDIRDYISVIVSGVLAKSRNLCKLNVRLCLADFNWPHEQSLANTKIILAPFERLRNVRQPQILGVWVGRPHHNSMISVQRPPQSSRNTAHICSVPPLPSNNILINMTMPDFDAYATSWRDRISSKSPSSTTSKPAIRTMFTEFKDFYSKLSLIVPDVSRRGGRYAFLHRARVAREQEDIESFRAIRNELIYSWNAYLDTEERKKQDMNARMSKMLDADTYPSHEWYSEPITTFHSSSSSSSSSSSWQDTNRRNSTATSTSSTSPTLLNPARLAKEGIPMTANQPREACLEVKTSCPLRQDYTIYNLSGLHLFFQGLKRHSPICQEVQHRAVALYLDRQLCVEQLPVVHIMEEFKRLSRMRDEMNANFEVGSLSGHAAMESGEWFEGGGESEAGPSTKRRRIDSGFSEMVMQDERGDGIGNGVGDQEPSVAYVGKGKGRAEAVGM